MTKQILKTYTLSLKPLSPIFIGCGVVAEPIQMYYGTNGKTYFPTPKQAQDAIEKLAATAIKDDYNAKYRNNERERIDSCINLSEHKTLFETHLDTLNVLYAKGVANKKIQLFQHNYLGYYIPGSSMKGAFRTLLLKTFFPITTTELDKLDVIAQKNKDDKRKKPFSEAATSIIETFEKEKLNETETMTKSVLRCFRFADTAPLDPNHMRIEQVHFSPRPERHIAIHQVMLMPTHPPIKVNVTVDVALLEALQNKRVNPNFFDSLLHKFKEHIQTKEVKNPLYKSDAHHDTIEVSDEANFYLGANTGFDRHTLWDAQRDTLHKKKLLETLFRKITRGHDKHAPRQLRVYKTTTYGWCKLTVVDA